MGNGETMQKYSFFSGENVLEIDHGDGCTFL